MKTLTCVYVLCIVGRNAEESFIIYQRNWFILVSDVVKTPVYASRVRLC